MKGNNYKTWKLKLSARGIIFSRPSDRIIKHSHLRYKKLPALLNYSKRVFKYYHSQKQQFNGVILNKIILQVHKNLGLNLIHGDLSTKNIVLQNSSSPVLIDWISNLNSYEGTPYYAHPLVYKGVHNKETELFALEKILTKHNHSIYN